MVGEQYKQFLDDVLGDASRFGPSNAALLRQIELGTERYLLAQAREREVHATRDELLAERRACNELLRPVWERGLLGHEITHWPSGPGSARAMELIYQNRPLHYDLASHYTEWFLLTRDLAHAVRSRKDLLAELLVAETRRRAGDLRILDLACGPCQSLREALPQLDTPSRIDLWALDTDDLAQAHNRAFFHKGHGLPWKFDTANALRTDFGEGVFDLVYSTGLYDYLTTPTLVDLWGRVYTSLKPGGVALLSVKDGARFCPLFYRWAVPWSQFHIRNEADFEAALAKARLPSPEAVRRDATGCIVFYVVRKPG